MSESKKMVCNFNLRPRIAGKAVFIEAGTPFDESFIDKESKAMMMAKNDLWYEDGKPASEKEPDAVPSAGKKTTLAGLKKEAKERYGVELKGKDFNSKAKVSEELARLKKEAAPHGFFKEDPEALAEFQLEELDALHTQICAEHDLPTPDPFETVEDGIAKLTGASE